MKKHDYRTIKPEMRSDERVCSWPIPVRWTFLGLISYVDDQGRARDDVRLMKAQLYPLDDTITPRAITQHLDLIAEDSGPVCRYEVAGKRYLHLTNWKEHQKIPRAFPSDVPPCPVHEPAAHERATSVRNETQHARNTKQDATQHASNMRLGEERRGEEKEREKEKNKDTTPAAPSLIKRFDDFWAVYPKKVSKDAAKRRWATRMREGVDPDEIIAGAKRYADRVTDTEPRFIKHPDSWLFQGRWQDEEQAAPPRRPDGWEFGMDIR